MSSLINIIVYNSMSIRIRIRNFVQREIYLEEMRIYTVHFLEIVFDSTYNFSYSNILLSHAQ